MSDKDNKKPKQDKAVSDATDDAEKVSETGNAEKADGSGNAADSGQDQPVTDDLEVAAVVVGQTAVPVTAVETDGLAADDSTPGDKETGKAPEDDLADEADSKAEPAPAAAPVAASVPRRADRGARFLAFIAILLALAVGATTILPQVRGGSADRIAQMQSDIDSLTERNRTLAEQLASADAAPATAASPVDLSGMEARLTEIEAALADVSGLRDRLTEIENAAPVAGAATASSNAVSQADIEALRAEIAAIAAAASGSASVTIVPQGDGGDEGASDALLAELAGMEERLAAIESNTGEAGIATGDLRDSLEALRNRMEALASEADALSQRVDDLAAAAEGQQSQADAEAAQKAALVLALGRMRDVAATSSAFPGAWNSVVELGVDPAGHPAIADAAQHGIATVDDLRQRFAAVADAALTAERIGGDDTWYGAAFQRLGNLVSVRRVGDVEGTSVEAIVTRAEARLQEGNLEAALAELDGLSGPPAEAVASWRSTAEARMELERAIRTLQQGIFQNMARED